MQLTVAVAIVTLLIYNKNSTGPRTEPWVTPDTDEQEKRYIATTNHA